MKATNVISMKIKSRFLLALVCFLGWMMPNNMQAQDIHFSQFYETTILRNPALTGIYSGDYKVIAQYKSQWNSIGSPFQTALVSGETKIPLGEESPDFFAVGVLAYYDQSGSINLKTLGAYPSVTFHKSLEDGHQSFLSVGFTGGYIQRSFDVSKMTFDNQYGAGGFNQYNPTGEAIANPRIHHWDVGAGINFSSTAGDNNAISYFIGASGYHFTKPNRSFDNNAFVRLEMKWNGNAGLNYKINENFGLVMQANYAKQGTSHEIIAGGLLSWKKESQPDVPPEFMIYGGAFYRFGDALIPTVKLDYQGYSFGASYDFNISRLRAASNLKGGFELTIVRTGKYKDPRYNQSRTLCPKLF